MVKHEQYRTTDQLKRLGSIGSMTSLPLRPLMSQTILQTTHRRSFDSHAIDISSIHGRFAWEKIEFGDTYIPVIFRGTTKYFCIKMLHKLLHDYPEDVIRRSSQFQYWKPIDLYGATSNEIELLNYINTHHCHWTYSREPFTNKDELVRVLDFIPFYEHLRRYGKLSSASQTSSTDSLRPILPQPQQRQQSMQGSPDFVVDLQKSNRRNSTLSDATSSISIRPHIAQELPQRNIPSNPRPIAPSLTPRPMRPPSYGAQQFALRSPSTLLQQRKPTPSISAQPLTAIPSNSMFKSVNTVLSNNVWPPSTPSPVSQSLAPTASSLAINSTSSSPLEPSLLTPHIRKQPINSLEKQLVPAAKPSSFSSSSSSTSSKSPRLHCGWLQINKLYTPYVANNLTNHHLYKIPISLLTFYDLLKFPSLDNNTNDPKYASFLSDQILVTPQEIELINELCVKQSIKPFSVDTKLINLSTFYQYCSANIIFVKELPLNEPKASICKDWSSIVQINGGICRLRNTTTLHEQTVPFIGNNLLKTFIISSQCLASASLTTPTSSEMEFLQLILFFSNISINLRNAKLIDIESVQKEYNVDLILLFNDKFPSNVLNYQHQGNRSSTSQEQTNQSNSSAAANTFAESTPPPSPLSPPTNNPRVHATAQLPLTSQSSSSSSSASTAQNRFQKTISFQGHTMTAYICSGIGVNNSQRECVSVKALCDMLYPNSSILDKLETRMLRLLRLKSINRFRPQSHQTLDFTRLVDITDIEKHWEYIEKGMCSLSNIDEEPKTVEVVLSLSDIDFKASTLDTVENNSEKIDEPEISIEIVKGEKRPIEGEMDDKDIDEENTPVLERLEKRLRSSEVDNNEQSKPIPEQLVKIMDEKPKHVYDDESQDDDDDDDDDVKKKPIIAQRKPIPCIKIVKQKTNNETQKKSIQRPIDRKPGKSTLVIRKPTVSGKKKIRLVKRKPTPSVRSSEPIIAKWVRKYCIEDCCIRLNKYNPIYETGRD